MCVNEAECDASDQAAAQAAIASQNAIAPHSSTGTLNAGYNTINESTTTSQSCQNTCKINVTFKVWLGAVTGNQYEIFDQTTWGFVGGECTNLAPSNTTSKAANIGFSGEGTGCKSGFTYGTVNGKSGCHYHGQANSHPPNTSTSTGTGTTTSTTTDNGDGTSTTTSTTTTTTTTTGGGGGGPRCYGTACSNLEGEGGGEGEESEGEGSAITGGTCVTGNVKPPNCLDDQDPVQCGIFLEQWQARCNAQLHDEKLFGKESDLQTADSVIGDADANQVQEGEVDFGNVVSSVLNENEFTFNGVCPAPKTFGFQGYSFEIPYDWFCNFAEGIRPFVIALGYVVATFMVITSLGRKTETA